ncbi:hypothetical protein CDIK_3859, partial [Cucumispora dikerogammari]
MSDTNTNKDTNKEEDDYANGNINTNEETDSFNTNKPKENKHSYQESESDLAELFKVTRTGISNYNDSLIGQDNIQINSDERMNDNLENKILEEEKNETKDEKINETPSFFAFNSASKWINKQNAFLVDEAANKALKESMDEGSQKRKTLTLTEIKGTKQPTINSSFLLTSSMLKPSNINPHEIEKTVRNEVADEEFSKVSDTADNSIGVPTPTNPFTSIKMVDTAANSKTKIGDFIQTMKNDTTMFSDPKETQP